MAKKHHGERFGGPLKLGRLPRAFDPAIPHLSMLLAAKRMQPPATADWSVKFGPNPNLGMMLNDSLGDCTCAGLGHAIQTWTANAQAEMVTIPDQDVELLYEGACGFDPNNANGTDNGGVEQDVLAYAMNTGIPTPSGAHKIAGYLEVDPRNYRDVRLAIAEFGGAYIGFNVPAFLENLEDPGSTWNIDPSADNTIVGGHCVFLVGYDAISVRLISWGALYRMTWPFFNQFVDEVYAIADADWIEATGKSPAGLSLAQIEDLMGGVKT